MHSHDRTLLSRLGFADPDKHDVRHDLACRYLAMPANARRLVDLALSDYPRRVRANHWLPDPSGELLTCFDYEARAANVAVTSRELEVEIGKGQDQYHTTIGFLDVLVGYNFQEARAGSFRGRDGTRMEHSYLTTSRLGGSLVVEVKVKPENVGNILRQINLYRRYCGRDPTEYSHGCHWFVATAYPMTSGDRGVLAHHGVTHLRLGEAFDAYVAEASQKAEDDGRDAIEF